MTRRSLYQRRGFTLFEIIMALSIFVFLAGGVYLAVSVSVQSSAELTATQLETRRLSAFVRFLREGFASLPTEAEFHLKSVDQGRLGRGVELLIRNAPGAFETGALASSGSGVVLATRPDGRGKSRFAITRFPSSMDEGDRERFLEKAKWLPILEDVETLRWRFWDKTFQEFVETWDQPAQRPELIELTFQTAAVPETVCLFRLPGVGRAGRSRSEQPQPTPVR